jgi:hypothetical protein
VASDYFSPAHVVYGAFHLKDGADKLSFKDARSKVGRHYGIKKKPVFHRAVNK